MERRLSPRQSTAIPAVIVFDGGRTGMECIIRNLSETGAKIEVSSVAKVPKTFDLIAPGYRAHPCRVAWRTLRELGVAFTD